MKVIRELVLIVTSLDVTLSFYYALLQLLTVQLSWYQSASFAEEEYLKMKGSKVSTVSFLDFHFVFCNLYIITYSELLALNILLKVLGLEGENPGAPLQLYETLRMTCFIPPMGNHLTVCACEHIAKCPKGIVVWWKCFFKVGMGIHFSHFLIQLTMSIQLLLGCMDVVLCGILGTNG